MILMRNLSGSIGVASRVTVPFSLIEAVLTWW